MKHGKSRQASHAAAIILCFAMRWLSLPGGDAVIGRPFTQLNLQYQNSRPLYS
jgi:hypothetical protein